MLRATLSVALVLVCVPPAAAARPGGLRFEVRNGGNFRVEQQVEVR